MSGSRRTAIVTGAAMGLGQAISVRLAEAGHGLVLVDIASTAETEELLRPHGVDVRSEQCDVSSPEQVARMAAAVRDSGDPALILIANVGIYPIAPFLETSWETWRQVLSVNLDSLYLLLQEFLPPMLEAEWGRVVGVSSAAFYLGSPLMAPYLASKGGMIGLFRCLATELGDGGITLNTVAPSMMVTPGTEAGPHREMGWFEAVPQGQSIKRPSDPSDVVGAVAFLASEEAGFITGQTLPVDGGFSHV